MDVSSEAKKINNEFRNKHYTSEHTSKIKMQVYGVEPRVAAGDEELQALSLAIKKSLKNTLKSGGSGPLTKKERELLEGDSVLVDDGPRIKITEVVIDSQTVGDEQDASTRRLQFGSGGGWNTGNGFNYSTVNYACLYCPNDNGDGRRRHLQEELEISKMVQGVEDDLKGSPWEGILSRGGGCIKMQIDDSDVVGTIGCKAADEKLVLELEQGY